MAALALVGALMLPTAIPAPPDLVATTQELGFEASAYRGEYFIKSQESYRECVAYREGRHNYAGTGNNGYHLGTYQFTADLARGAIWMMAKEWSKKYGKATARAMRVKLHKVKPTKWSRAIWDQAFYTILNWNGRGSGEKHWAAQRGNCAGAK